MDQKRCLKISHLVAMREVLNTKIPSTSTPKAFEKWVSEGADELGISCEEFAEYVQTTLQEAVDEVKSALDHFKTTKKQYGFIHSASGPDQKK